MKYKAYDLSKKPKVIFKNGKEYRLVVVRKRGKYIAEDGDAINPFRVNQEVKIKYNRDGYPCFGGSVPIHLYVAHGWVDGYKDGMEVDYKDFNRNNYHASNLQWITHEENVHRSVKENAKIWNDSKAGEHNGRALLKESDVIKIRQLYDDGLSVREIVENFFPNCSENERKRWYVNVYNICIRKTWQYLD